MSSGSNDNEEYEDFEHCIVGSGLDCSHPSGMGAEGAPRSDKTPRAQNRRLNSRRRRRDNQYPRKPTVSLSDWLGLGWLQQVAGALSGQFPLCIALETMFLLIEVRPVNGKAQSYLTLAIMPDPAYSQGVGQHKLY
jgi:hypothetical protein